MTSEMELVVDAGGDVRCVYGEELDLREIGKLQITRASHVEPDSCPWTKPFPTEPAAGRPVPSARGRHPKDGLLGLLPRDTAFGGVGRCIERG